MPGLPTNYGSASAIDAQTGRAALAVRTTYLALLTTTISKSATMATMPEVQTSGYGRQPVTWTAPSLIANSVTYHSVNTASISIGPFASDMLIDAQAAALVDVLTGTAGNIIFTWELDQLLHAGANESIVIPAGTLEIQHN